MHLPRQWRAHAATYGNLTHGPFHAANPHPLYVTQTSRRDAWPPGGGLPGSDLAFMRAQHLDPNNIACGIMIPLFGGTASRNLEFGAALCSAVNQWQIAEFISQEPRLRGSIQVPAEDTETAVAEIERHAGNSGFVQVQVGSSTIEPVGRKRYWPIFAAAECAGLPIGMHVGGSSGHPRSGGGWPSFYVEAHYDLTHTTQAQITSMVLEGVFERFPSLKVVLIEGGFGWAPPLAWRLDRLWAQMRDEVPYVKRPPSEYMREHLYYTTQPMEEPDEPDDVLQVFAQIGWDRVMFSTGLSALGLRRSPLRHQVQPARGSPAPVVSAIMPPRSTASAKRRGTAVLWTGTSRRSSACRQPR